MKKVLFFGLALGFFLLFPSPVLAGRGCCSWHGGQSYCDTSVGRWVCADGTYSPSCGCTYIPPKVVVPATPKPTIKPTIKPTPIATPTLSPSPTPEVKSASVESTITPFPTPQAAAGSIVGGLASGGIMLGFGYLALRWLARITAPKEPENTV